MNSEWCIGGALEREGGWRNKDEELPNLDIAVSN